MQMHSKVPPLLVAAVVAAGMWVAARAFPGSRNDGIEWRAAAAAAVLAVAGLGIGASGVLAFRRARTTVNPMRPDAASALVTSGVYQWTRNPMYVGVTLALAGWAVWLGSWAAGAGPVLFWAWMNWVQVPAEETAMERVFGDAYRAYRESVRRWV